MGQFSSYSTATSFTTWISPATPSITSPTEAQTNISRNPTITSSAFSSPDSLSHTSSTWQIATDSGFLSVVWSKSADTTNKVSIVVNATNGTFAGALAGKTMLAVSTSYYVRVKYTDSESTESAYSTGVSFTVRAAQVNKNSVDVQSPWDSDLPDTASKPSTVGTSEVAPTADNIDGTVLVDSDGLGLYWRVSDTWKHIHDDSTYAVTAKGVTNGDSHDHAGGDGAQIDHTGLANLNSANYTHLTATNHTDLTDSGASTLHYHAADRVDANQTFTDITTNNASTTAHGFLIKATAPASGVRNVVAIDNGETVYKNTALVDSTNPSDLAGTASPGTSLLVARRDHVHLGLTSTQLTDLTDSGATTLHKHDHGGQDGLADDDHTQYVLRQPAADTVINESGADFDFRIEGDTEDNLFYINAGTDEILMGDMDTNYAKVSKAGLLSFAGTGGISLPHLMQSDTTDQAIADTGAAQVITFNQDVHHQGITRTSSSRFTCPTAGSYLITFSGIALCSTAGKRIEVWLRINGNDVANSNTVYIFKAANANTVIAVSFIEYFSANDYFEFWTWGDDTGAKWDYTAAVSAPSVVRPAAPSIIMTCNMVSKD